MEIGRKLKKLREDRNLSQGDIEKRTGLLRCYTSRVENGYTVPSVDTLEKYARALEVPLYRFFTDEEAKRALPRRPKMATAITGESVARNATSFGNLPERFPK